MYKEMRPYLNLFYNIEYRLPQTITKIKPEIDYDVTNVNVHQVKTTPLFYKYQQHNVNFGDASKRNLI